MLLKRKVLCALVVCFCLIGSCHIWAQGQLPPVRTITKGPGFHWFAYYDKLQFDPTGRYVLGMEVDFEGRTPRSDDVIQIGMVDLHDGDKWIKLGTSSAWGWQQGCMLQWRPGSKSEILYNDRQEGRYVCRIVDVFTRKVRTVDHPIYSVSPNGKVAVSADFRRIQDMRPGYGYAGLADPHKDKLAPVDSGVFLVDLDTGKAKLIVSLAQMTKIPYEKAPKDSINGKHWFNHLLFSPDGERFIFLDRWRVKKDDQYSGFRTRMFTAAVDGSDIRMIDGYGRTSHFIWRDAANILAWAWHPSHNNAFYLYGDGTDKVDVIGKGVMKVNGHCTYLPGNEWILNDTYPSGSNREQNVYLYNVNNKQRVPLGGFSSPKTYSGEWRCDTHPRFSPDGKMVCIDSPHGGNGRQMYLIDISHALGEIPGTVTENSAIMQSRFSKGDVLPKMLIAAGKRGAVIIEDGKVISEFKTRQSCQDAWMLENGDVLATETVGVTMYDKDGKVLMQYTKEAGKKRELHSCQPLPEGGILVAESGPARLLELDKTGKVVKEMPVKDIKYSNAHLQMRGARKNKKGEYAVISSGEMRLIVLKADGTTKRIVELEKLPKNIKHHYAHALALLDNGNILVSTSYGSCFVELDPAGKVIWSLTPEDLPELKLKYAAGMQRLANGNTICTAYNSIYPIFEVTPDKKIVWKIAANKDIGTPLHVQVINKKDKPSTFKLCK